jgi:phosphate transport system substrate-binding protein
VTGYRRVGRILFSGLCIFWMLAGSHAQPAESLAQVKKIYVGSLGDEKASGEMRERIEDRLRASRRFQVVATAAEADATVRGTGRIWTTGYVSLSVHASRANREAEFDGYLSVDLVGKGNTTLWSYLFTPSKFSVKKITTDLADQVVPRLISAVEEESHDNQVVGAKKNGAAVSLHGAGATFPWPLYQKWFESYREKAPHVRISYDPVGSEMGIRMLSKGSVDFAGSDMPLGDETMAQSKVKFRHVAAVLGAVVPIYNLRGANSFLNFSPAALAGIYLGTIKRWNDPILKASNPGVSMPDSEIVVVHRSDGSGTTFAWADYLAKVSPEWKQRAGAPGTTISWPVGWGAERNEGVAALVRRTPNSIGYVELIYAIQHELRFGAVQNAEGNYVKADLASVTAAAAGVAGRQGSDFRVSITNAPGKSAYPIATFTWWLLPENEQEAKREAVVEFLRWALTAGQKECSGLGYAPLPAGVASEQLKALDQLKK